MVRVREGLRVPSLPPTHQGRPPKNRDVFLTVPPAGPQSTVAPSRPDSDIYVQVNPVRYSALADLASRNIIKGNVVVKNCESEDDDKLS